MNDDVPQENRAQINDNSANRESLNWCGPRTPSLVLSYPKDSQRVHWAKCIQLSEEKNMSRSNRADSPSLDTSLTHATHCHRSQKPRVINIKDMKSAVCWCSVQKAWANKPLVWNKSEHKNPQSIHHLVWTFSGPWLSCHCSGLCLNPRRQKPPGHRKFGQKTAAKNFTIWCSAPMPLLELTQLDSIRIL